MTDCEHLYLYHVNILLKTGADVGYVRKTLLVMDLCQIKIIQLNSTQLFHADPSDYLSFPSSHPCKNNIYISNQLVWFSVVIYHPEVYLAIPISLFHLSSRNENLLHS